MKQFAAFVRKEFLHIFRDSRTMLILLVMPVVQMILFGFAISTEVRNACVAVLDEAKTTETVRLTDALQASEYFTVMPVRTPAEADRLFREGKTGLTVIFKRQPNSATQPIACQLITDASDPNQATMLSAYASQIIKTGSIGAGHFQYSTFNVQSTTRMLYNPQMRGAYNFVPGVMGLILMLICAMMTSISIVREKETGTMEVLLISPVKPLYITLAKIVPYFALSVVNLTTILLLSYFVLNVPIAGNLGVLIFICLLYIALSLSIGILISNIVTTQVAAMLISGMVMMIPTMLLSGMIFPIESMPPIFRWLSAVLPPRWFIDAVKKVMIQGAGIAFVWKNIAILGGMTALILVVALKKFKTRL
ncbi:MAG: ABC transporter permease [Prevotellaceae bacterium]|jgi:ABC-2 type transport system permease protein|nr:ABC transporter permease [Prevotellaceae bacterium]